MRPLNKTCPACQTTFKGKRKNQIYCTAECRADTNNYKLKVKYNAIKELEKQSDTNVKYKDAYLNSTRIVILEFDERDKNETIIFEGFKFEKMSLEISPLTYLGLSLGENTVKGNQRVGIYYHKEGILCFLSRYSTLSSMNYCVSYRRIPNKV